MGVANGKRLFGGEKRCAQRPEDMYFEHAREFAMTRI